VPRPSSASTAAQEDAVCQWPARTPGTRHEVAAAKAIGATLERGQAALIVIGLEKDSGEIERAVAHARIEFNCTVGDWDEGQHEAVAAIERAEASPTG